MSEPSKPAYRQRPLEAEAVQWTGTNADQLRAFAGSDFDTIDPQDRIEDEDQDAQLLVEASHWVGIQPGDWVLKFEGYFVAKADAAFRAVWEPAVSSSAPADRAVLEGARGIARRLAAHAVGFQDVLDDTDRGPWARTVGADIAALCTALGERTAPAPPAVDLAAAPDPTPLRWGLNDVLWGDDDTVTVLLSGPAGEPYWLELDPERAGVLREDLAGPDGAVAVDRAAVLDEAADALDAYIARYRSPSIANWTGAVTFLHRMAGEARDERETQANLDTLAEDLHRWTDEAQQHEPGVVAYRSSGARVLRCLTHAPVDLTGFTPVTSEDLPDGGICTHPDCGVDVLIPQQPEAAEGAQQ